MCIFKEDPIKRKKEEEKKDTTLEKLDDFQYLGSWTDRIENTK